MVGPYRLSLAFVLSLVVAPACGQAFSSGSGIADAGGDGPSGSGSGSASSSSGAGSSSGSPQGDAESSTCQGAFHCVPGVPVGWSGPVELYDGTITPPPCDSGFSSMPTYDGNDQLTAPAATCGCSCDGATGVQCAAPTLSVYSLMGCAASDLCATHVLGAGQCASIDFSSGCGGGPTLVELALPEGAASGGSCSPQPSKALPPTSWSAAGRACAPASPPAPANCPAQSVCAPRSSSPYLQGLCIMHDGDAACPALGYSVKHVLYAGIDDTRDCTACTCGGVTGSSCTTTLLTFPPGTPGCTATPNTLTAPVTCSTGIPAQQSNALLKMGATGGTCTPGNVQPTGSATPAGPTTFCCLP
ncbi:MAG TPA: hypothetical protein VF765_35510 [Polyangiaceae bacterium]